MVLPGLINTHHHFYQTLTRAVPAALDRELFPWLQALYPIWARLTPEALDLGMTVAMAELLLSGCTTTTDHHYVFPTGLEDSIDIEVAAAKRLGLRVLLTRGSMNLSQRDGGLPPDSVVQDEDTILADSERVVTRYHEAGDGRHGANRARPLLAVFGDNLADEIDRGARRIGSTCACTPISPRPRTRTVSAWNSTNAARSIIWRIAAGSTTRTWLAHGIHFDAGEIKRLARAGTTISHCPCSNQTLGFRNLPGLRHGGRRHAYRHRRRRLGVERRLEPDAGGARGIPAAAQPLWRQQGQSPRCVALGDEGLGGLRRHEPISARSRVGKMADLALFKLDELRFSGSGDPLAALVLCGAHRADRVMVGGRWVVEDGAIPGLDLTGLIERHSAAARKLQSGR